MVYHCGTVLSTWPTVIWYMNNDINSKLIKFADDKNVNIMKNDSTCILVTKIQVESFFIIFIYIYIFFHVHYTIQ